MTNTANLIDKIIPPSDYEHRNGFSNDNIIDKLSIEEKSSVESELINMLPNYNGDTLIIETLAYMNSKKAIEPLKNLLQEAREELTKIIIASSIFKISPDKILIDIARDAFMKIEVLPMNYFYNKSNLISSFYYLTLFGDIELNKLIKPYTKHSDYLVSYNATRFSDNQ
jgi:hypothetical protein